MYRKQTPYYLICVLTVSTIFNVFSDVNEGGDCSLIRQFHLSNKDEQSHASSSSPEAVKMEQQNLEVTDQVDSSEGERKLSESK